MKAGAPSSPAAMEAAVRRDRSGGVQARREKRSVDSQREEKLSSVLVDVDGGYSPSGSRAAGSMVAPAVLRRRSFG